MKREFLTQSELAKRWGISPRTLERWRWAGEGLRFVKIGGLVRYRLEDVEAYEDSKMSVDNRDSGSKNHVHNES